MFTYFQVSGALCDPLGNTIGKGYSGYLAGKNQPALQRVRDVGPIPKGTYLIGKAFDSPDHGPLALPLLSMGDTDTFGRDGFLMHGDSICIRVLLRTGASSCLTMFAFR